MKRKIVIFMYAILVLITIKVVFNFTVNSILIYHYKNSQYSEKDAKPLTYLNFLQSYVAEYNYANILYQKGEYEKAIEKYQKALKGRIPEKKECSVRINYALALCQTVQVDEEEPESITKAISIYENAIEILIEKGCAHQNDDNGHSQRAEKLKKDIQKEIERLKKLQKSEEGKEDNQEKKENKTKEDPETKIQDIKENATKEQRKMESFYKNYHKSFNREGKNW